MESFLCHAATSRHVLGLLELKSGKLRLLPFCRRTCWWPPLWLALWSTAPPSWIT